MSFRENKWKFLIISCILQTVIWLFNQTHKLLIIFNIELIPLTFEKLIEPLTPEQRKEASRQDFATPLQFYLEGFNRNPQTSGFHRFVILEKARSWIKIRESVRSQIKQNPDILQTPVDGALAIVGLPRSGTTMLQRLLSADKQLLSTMLWELMLEPKPPGRPENWRQCDRYLKAKEQFYYSEAMGLIGSPMDAKHEVGVELDEECLLLLSTHFLDMPDPLSVRGLDEMRYFMYNCPKEHIKNAYQHYKQALQCMYYKNLDDGKLLSLKAPIHALWLDTYQEVLPNAKFVFTYRNVGVMVSSLCSLTYQIGLLNGFSGHKEDHGKRVLEYFKHASSRSVKFLQNAPKESYIIFGYTELVKDPLAAVKKIYSHFGMTLSPEAENAMRIRMQENKKDKHGKHHYSLEEFGITEADLRENFAEFLEYFKDWPEKLI